MEEQNVSLDKAGTPARPPLGGAHPLAPSGRGLSAERTGGESGLLQTTPQSASPTAPLTRGAKGAVPQPTPARGAGGAVPQPTPARGAEGAETPSAEEAERFAAWRAQAEQAKALYPDLDLGAELEGERFRGLLLGGVDVQTAFEATHREALLQSVMREATLAAEKRIAARFLVSRPAENGLAAASPAVSKVDVAKLSRQQRKALIRRAQAGEKIRL